MVASYVTTKKGKGKAKKSTTPRTTVFSPSKKKELPWVGFEPTTLCSLGERSTS